MAKPRIEMQRGRDAVRAVADSVGGEDASRDDTATAVRYLLQCLVEKIPGHTVEMRVPPFGAVQCVEGAQHTRGTPPNVIEIDSLTWVALATGTLTWADAMAHGRIHASGTRADISHVLPLRF